MNLNPTEEANVLLAVLDNLDPDRDARLADRIVASLIETGLLDARTAPEALRIWAVSEDRDEIENDILAIYGVY